MKTPVWLILLLFTPGFTAVQHQHVKAITHRKIEKISFDYFAADLSPANKQKLNKLAASLIRHPAQINIEGVDIHDDDYDVPGGMEIARKVTNYLVKKGCNPLLIYPKGEGGGGATPGCGNCYELSVYVSWQP